MKTTYAFALIGCVFIFAAGLMAGCTGTAGTAPVTETPAVSPAMDTTVATTASPVQPASTAPVAGENASSATVTTLFVNATSNGKIVTIPAGERVLVRLNENPTTGYTWNATASKGLEIISDSYTAPDNGLIGAGGYHEWILSPKTVDTYTFNAVSLRPWEGAQPTDEKFGFVLLVTKD
jgi:inhibitor of cysteine peptidase